MEGLVNDGKDFGLDALRNVDGGLLHWVCAENLLPHRERVPLFQLQLDFLFLQRVIGSSSGTPHPPVVSVLLSSSCRIPAFLTPVRTSFGRLGWCNLCGSLCFL